MGVELESDRTRDPLASAVQPRDEDVLNEVEPEPIQQGDVVFYRHDTVSWPALVVTVHPDNVLDVVILHAPVASRCSTFAGRLYPWSGSGMGWERKG